MNDEGRRTPGGPPEPLVFVNRTPGQRLDKFLCDRMPGRSRSYIQHLIRTGHVTLSCGNPKPSTSLLLGARVEVRIPPPRGPNLAPADIPLKIIYEDDDIAVVDKAPGIVIHPSPGYKSRTLVHGLLFHLTKLSGIAGKERPGIVHRLDRDTSGILLVAKNDLSHQRMSLLFKTRKVSKGYLAITHAGPSLSQGTIDLPIGRALRDPKKMAIRYDGGRAAVTEYRVKETFDGFALLSAFPLTGRTHQIRVHLRYLGAPVVCDGTYGKEKRIYLSDLKGTRREGREHPVLIRQALHAHTLSLRHPRTDEPLAFESPLPADLEDFLRHLRELRPAGGAATRET